ncbi:MAG: hypothetical protein ACI9CA_000716 [Natronomonas sp.]|jgi:hypothetical protein
MDSRVLTAAVGVAASLLVSVLVWVVFDTLLLLFLVPFVPFLFRAGREREDEGPAVRECPVCDYRTTDRRHEYCPRDGHRLE